MKNLFLKLIFSASLIFSSLMMGASHSEMVARAGVLIEIDSDSDTVKICNGTVIGTNTVLTAQHCVVQASGSYKNYGSIDSYTPINLNYYVFIAGEENSQGWFDDWHRGESYFFKKHPGAARVIGLKRYGHGQINPSNDLVHLLLDRDVIPEDQFSYTEFNIKKSQWDQLTMVAYTKYNCGNDTCLKRKKYAITAQANSQQSVLLYRFKYQKDFNTASFSGSSIIDQRGKFVGVHASPYKGDRPFDKAAFMFDKENFTQVINYLDRDFR